MSQKMYDQCHKLGGSSWVREVLAAAIAKHIAAETERRAMITAFSEARA